MSKASSRVCLKSIALVFLGLTASPVRSQITPDATLPNHSIVLPNGSLFTIEGGTQAGTNLFHSFEEFSIPTGSEAFFNNAQSIDNIITRVTGGNLSNIDGLIRANGTANLFLINPNGIVLGANAQLDIGGSFLGSTAERVLFADGSFYSATDTSGSGTGASPLLSVNVPLGLQMGSSSAAIEVNGNGHNFSVDTFAPLERNDTPSGFQTSGNTLALVGGDITLNGGILTAESGRLELGAVSGNAQIVGVEATDTQLTLDYTQVEQFGDIQLNTGAVADASGTGSGSIQIRGGSLLLDRGSALILENSGGQPAGSIDIQTTESVELINDDPNLTTGSFIFSDALNSGSAGNISIATPQLTMQGNNAVIRALTLGEAEGGNIDIDAGEIAISSGPRRTSSVALRTLGTGNSGNLSVEARTIVLDGGAFVNNVNGGSGSAGNITIEATESIELRGTIRNSLIGSSAVSAMGNAGEILIETPRLSVRDVSIISSSTFGAGSARSITVNASEFIQVEGSGFNGTANRFDPTQIRSAGILLPASVRERRGLPDTVTGNAGNVILNTPRLQVSDGATVTVRHESVGDAGNLQVNSDEILLDREGTLTASTISGEGGNIELQGLDALQLRDGAAIDAESFGIGNGGNITINSNSIALLENSQINASALEGAGGNINISTLGLFVSGDSSITASSQFGVDGIVSVDNPIIDPASGLVAITTDPLNSNTQLQDSCDIATRSRFAITGNGGLPPDPTESFQSPTLWRDTRLGEIDTTEIDLSNVELTPHSGETVSMDAPPDPLIEATGWTRREDGTVELVARSGSTHSPWHPSPDCQTLTQSN